MIIVTVRWFLVWKGIFTMGKRQIWFKIDFIFFVAFIISVSTEPCCTFVWIVAFKNLLRGNNLDMILLEVKHIEGLFGIVFAQSMC
jgi:hypothetical protein